MEGNNSMSYLVISKRKKGEEEKRAVPLIKVGVMLAPRKKL
jgi:hypothetical protein